ncbi:UNVERIFIED_CONTAM: hypothetical protein FKN15_019247, partial [Acipenser sinensis]
DLGLLSQAGFHLGFGYSGPCIFLSRVRVYFKKCPGFSEGRADFPGAAGGAGQIRGACVENSIEVSPPLRECGADGIWGDLEGQCVCDRGYQETGQQCEACRIGYYKPANRSEGCRQCPPNSKTEAEGAESCQCMMGYFRLDSDPVELGCTKPPSAPQNLTFSLHQSSVTLSWDPPGDLGGRGDVQYAVGCWERAGSKDWEHCGDTVHYPRTSILTNTTVTVTGLQGALQYRFHVEASNAVSATSGAARATSAVSITKCEPFFTTLYPHVHCFLLSSLCDDHLFFSPLFSFLLSIPLSLYMTLPPSSLLLLALLPLFLLLFLLSSIFYSPSLFPFSSLSPFCFPLSLSSSPFSIPFFCPLFSISLHPFL